MLGSFIVAFIFGLFIGSFLNSIVFRIEAMSSIVKLPKGASPFSNRSFCPSCGHMLSWLDLVPVLSILFLNRKCRYCKDKISSQYLLAEVLTGLLFGFIFLFYGNIVFTYFLFLISFFLIILFIYDLKHFILPDSILIPAILIALGYVYIFNYSMLFNYVFSGLGVSAFFLAIFLISRGKWIGFGDVKLGLLIGLLIGFPNVLVSIFFSFLVGAIVGLTLIVLKKKKLKSAVPFGPFLIFGIYFSLFFGEYLVNWYLNLIL